MNFKIEQDNKSRKATDLVTPNTVRYILLINMLKRTTVFYKRKKQVMNNEIKLIFLIPVSNNPLC